MQTSQLKCIHPQHFVKKYEKRQELCNATPVNTYSIHILCRCLRLPKKKKHALLFEQHFASRIILFLCCTIIQDCKLLLFTTVLAFIFFYVLRCDSATQRDGGGLCDLYRACFGNDVAHFLLFRYIVPSR